MRSAIAFAMTVGAMTAAARAAGLAASLLGRLAPNGPVIVSVSDDAWRSLAAPPDGFGAIDLLATATMSGAKFDAPFVAIDPLFVDFRLVTDPLEADGFAPGTGF